jgi:hypothetical protein
MTRILGSRSRDSGSVLLRRSLMAAAGSVPLVMGWGGVAAAEAQKVGAPPEAKNMQLAGSNDLQARSAYQPTIARQGERYIAYIGHHGGKSDNPLTGKSEPNGTSVVDVTDPKNPKYLVHIPGEEGAGESGGAQMVRICDGKGLPKGDRDAVYMLRTFGNSGHEVWNVADPAQPRLVTKVSANLKGTHKNWWECDSGIAYLVSGLDGWRTRRMTEIYDLSDPAKPVKIRDYGLPGQQPGATGEVPTDLHGPIVLGNRVYFGYGTAKGGILQIVDRDKLLSGPKEPTPENLLHPEIGRLVMSPHSGAHTTYPLPRMPVPEFAKFKDGAVRDFVMIVNESTSNECQEASQFIWFADDDREQAADGVALHSAGRGRLLRARGPLRRALVQRELRAGLQREDRLLSWFNAGVRAIDIRDPFNPKEVAHFIPPITDKTDRRCVKVGEEQRCKVAIQTNNVETDDRGYIYIVDRANTGLHIVELTGPARNLEAPRPVAADTSNERRVETTGTTETHQH